MDDPVVIEVRCLEPGEFLAFLAVSGFRRPEWGRGRTLDEAIGDLVRAHPGRFGIQIEYQDDHARSPEPREEV